MLQLFAMHCDAPKVCCPHVTIVRLWSTRIASRFDDITCTGQAAPSVRLIVGQVVPQRQRTRDHAPRGEVSLLLVQAQAAAASLWAGVPRTFRSPDLCGIALTEPIVSSISG